MELINSKFILKTSNLVTISSYLKGTFIFALFTISSRNNDDIIMLGFGFIAIAFVLNLIVLFATLIAIYKEDSVKIKQQLKIAIAFQFANVPIAVAYFYYVINESRLF